MRRNMKEKELNTLIVKNFESAGGFAHKLPDPMFTDDSGQRFNLKRPFDGFSVLNDWQYYYETKLLKDYQAFPFQKLSEHQIINLCLIDKNSAFVTPLIIIGIYLYRIGIDLFFIKPNMKAWEMRCSIVKRQLEEFRDNGLYLPVRKKTFDVLKIHTKIIEIQPYKLNGKPRVELSIDSEEDDYAEALFED